MAQSHSLVPISLKNPVHLREQDYTVFLVIVVVHRVDIRAGDVVPDAGGVAGAGQLGRDLTRRVKLLDGDVGGRHCN